MKITDIRLVKKNLYAVFVDDKYFLNVDKNTLETMGLQVHDYVDKEKLEEIESFSNFEKAKEKALQILDYGQKTKRELYNKLSPIFGSAAAEKAIAYIEELGFVDDKKFAEDYAEMLMFKKGYAPSRTFYKLVQKGIDKDIAQEITESLQPDIHARLMALIEKKRGYYGDSDQGRRRLINWLRAKGYVWSDIREALIDSDLYYD